jgi:hypothetical protein
MAVYNYPGPCAPEYKKPSSVDDCLAQARLLAKKTIGRGALGPVKKGDNILIVTLADQDEYVKDAVTIAFKEEGAEKVDFIFEHELSGGEPRVFNTEEGWREADTMINSPWDLSGSMFYTDISENLRNYLNEHPNYTGVFWGLGGRDHQIFQMREHKHKFRNNWLFNSWEEFASKANVYPDELWIEIEKRIVEAVGKACEVRITDPEGTHIEYKLTPTEAKRWQQGVWLHGHLFMDPLMATVQENYRVPVSPKVPPVFRDLNGVLAGTSNHQGYIPHIRLFFEHGRLVEVKGGGKYGDLIREMMEKYKDVHWPGYPEKGFLWFCDTALCTLVKAFRHRSDLFHSYWRLPNLAERNRAGVFHLGFGSRRHGEEYLKYAQEHNLIMGHIHVHNYFATYEIKIQGTDHWYKIVDKGWLTAMDDPEIRALSVKYGEPDELFSYDWIPPLPGINCEGDYFKDYAQDPIPYLKKRLEQNKPI